MRAASSWGSSLRATVLSPASLWLSPPQGNCRSGTAHPSGSFGVVPIVPLPDTTKFFPVGGLVRSLALPPAPAQRRHGGWPCLRVPPIGRRCKVAPQLPTFRQLPLSVGTTSRLEISSSNAVVRGGGDRGG